MKLSVVICVYNCAPEYLEKCIASVRHSTLDMLQYEILLIDDGSQVDYTSIIDRYSVRCIKTENRGILAARTLGIESANGEYIVFVDSDDTVSFNYHRPMLECAMKSSTDVVYNDWAFHTERTRYYCKHDDTISGDISCSGEDVLLTFVRNEGRQHSFFVLWNKLYKRDILIKAICEISAIPHLPKRYNYSEDVLINFFVHRDAKSIKNLHTGYYFYRIHTSQSVSITSEDKLLGQINNMAFTFNTMRNKVGECKHRNRILMHIREWELLMARAHYSHAKGLGYNALYKVISEKYKIEKLVGATLKDNSAYIGNGIIASNIEDIDDVLYSVWSSGVEVSVKRSDLSKYAKTALEYMIAQGKQIKVIVGGKIIIPKEQISLKMQIVHSRPIAMLGILLFPKGSKLRAFLKRFL